MTHYDNEPDCLEEKVILVSGAGDGIGAAVAKDLAAHGATVILLGRTQGKLERVYDEIEQAGHPQPAIYPMEFQTAKPRDYRLLAETLHREFGRLDGLLHNAAVLGTLTPIEQYDLKLWSHLIQINLNAPFLLTRTCLPLLKKAESAALIFTSADVAFHGKAYWGGYAITKAATDNMMQILAEEMEVNTQVRVNCIDPGRVRTRMNALAFPGQDPNVLPGPEEITNTYVYLMSDATEGETGERFILQPKY